MNARNAFKQQFGYEPAVTSFAPGRVNLIGEHTDYNGGNVMPIALDLGVTIALAPRHDERLLIQSNSFGQVAERQLEDKAIGEWSDLAVGTIARASQRATGFDVAIASTLPHGSGLSSSAALCVALVKAVRRLESNPACDIKVALEAQSVENEFINVPCGVMDQMAVSNLSSGECMRLDTRTLKYARLAPPIDWVFVIHHSGIVRSLTEGRYAERRAECEVAAKMLGIEYLCALERPPASGALDDRLLRRVRHQVSENARVLAAEKALRINDIAAFAALMNQSHTSMRHDFQITTPEVDAVVDASRKAGALGARMTGGGFGGCIVSLVRRDALTEWRHRFEDLKATAAFVTAIKTSMGEERLPQE